MKRIIKRGVGVVIDFLKPRPKELRWSIYGIAIGMLAGALVGGIGIAALGAAWGLWGWLVFGIAGGMIGNRIGIEKDRLERGRQLRRP